MRQCVRIFLLTGFCLGQPAPAQTPTAPHSAPTPSNPRPRRTVNIPPIRAVLCRHVDRIRWDDAPLREIFDWLRTQRTRHGHVNVVPRWRALATAGISSDTLVTLELENTTVADVLFEVFDQIAGPDPVMYRGHGNVLRISTQSDFRRTLHTRAYDIAEILFKARATRVKSGIGIGQQSRFGRVTGTPGGGLGGTGENVDVGTTILGDVDNDDNDNDDRDDEDVEKFVNWIKSTVEPDTWDINGGPGTLAIFDGALIVRNSADVHAILGHPIRADR